MPSIYNLVSREELAGIAESITLAADKIAVALDAMGRDGLTSLYLTWTPATERAVSNIIAFALDAVREADEEAIAAKRGTPIRRAIAKQKSAREIARRNIARKKLVATLGGSTKAKRKRKVKRKEQGE